MAETPPHLRRLRMLFGEIEKEFDSLHRDNVSLREQLQLLQALGNTVAPPTPEDADGKASSEATQTHTQSTPEGKRSWSARPQPTSKTPFPRSNSLRETPTNRRHPDSPWSAVQDTTRHQGGGDGGSILDSPVRTGSSTRSYLTPAPSVASSVSSAAHNPAMSPLASHARSQYASNAAGQHAMARPGNNKGAHKQRIRDKIRLRGRKLVSNAVERVRDSSVAVTRVLRPQTDTVVEWAVSKQLTGHTDGVWDIRVCPWETACEDSIIGSASADRTARIWQADTGRELVCLVGHKGSVNSLSFHPYERLVSTASGDKSCGIWRLPPVVSADAENESLEALQAPDAGGGNLCLTRLRRKAMRPVLSLWGHSNAVSSAAWMASCGLIATASWDRSALLFDVASGASKPLRTLGGHDGPLTCIAAASTCSLLLSGARDCTGRLWDARSKMPLLHVLQGHSNTVTSVLFSHDDAFALTASDDCTVKVWDLKAWHTPVITLKCGRSGVLNLSLASRTGLMAAVLDNSTTRVYSMEGTKCGVLNHKFGSLAGDKTIDRHADRQFCSSMVTCSTWSRDETHIYSGGFDGSNLVVWEALGPV